MKSARSTTGSRAQTIFYTAAALIALLGVAEATYLTALYLSGETAVCGGSADCFQVLGSSYARIGPVPVSGLGALAYFGVFTFATFAGFGYARARQFFACARERSTSWGLISIPMISSGEKCRSRIGRETPGPEPASKIRRG